MKSTNDNDPTLIAKTARFETLLDKKIADLVLLVKSLEEQTKNLTLEVEELRAAREGLQENLREELQQSVRAGFGSAAALISQEVSKNFTQKTTHFIDDHLTSLKKLQHTAAQTIDDFKGLTWKSLGYSLLAAMLTGIMAFILCYVFIIPKPTPLELTPKQQKIMRFGQVLLDKFNELTSHDQQIIEEAYRATR
jgi:hypothetical protein